MTITYTCSLCGETNESDVPDDVAMAEAQKNFPGITAESRAVVCDDCFMRMQAADPRLGSEPITMPREFPGEGADPFRALTPQEIMADYDRGLSLFFHAPVAPDPEVAGANNAQDAIDEIYTKLARAFTIPPELLNRAAADSSAIEAEVKMAIAGRRVFYSPAIVEFTGERTFPLSRHRSRRIWKKLVRRFGGEYKSRPAIYQTPMGILAHPSFKEEIETWQTLTP